MTAENVWLVVGLTVGFPTLAWLLVDRYIYGNWIWREESDSDE